MEIKKIIKIKITKRKNKKFLNQKHKNIIKFFLIFILLIIIHFVEFIYFKIDHNNIIDIKDLPHKFKLMNHISDNITLVTAYIKIKSKHSYKNYLKWINNILQINHSFIFFIDRAIYKNIVNKRPQEYQNKTLWIKMDITNFYSYQNFYNEFNETYELDFEKKYQNPLLYITWAEKVNFLKMMVLKNYLRSKCFYWVDAGCFRNNKTIIKYINDWPSADECYSDGRVIINEVRTPSQLEKDKLKNFDLEAHIKFQKNWFNVDASLFGGQKEYILKFCDLYYDTIKLFIKKKLFIGKDQNIYAFIAYFNEDVIKLVHNNKYFYLQKYLSKDF